MGTTVEPAERKHQLPPTTGTSLCKTTPKNTLATAHTETWSAGTKGHASKFTNNDRRTEGTPVLWSSACLAAVR